MNSPDTQEMMDDLFVENQMLKKELKVSRKASEITARLVARQFSKTEEVLLRLEEQLHKASVRERELAEDKKRLEDMQIAAINMMEDLEISRKQADTATRAKSEFLANMSHEIRTPLNGVIGMTEILLDTALNRDQQHYVNTVQKSGESLLSVINDILDFSKIEAGKLEMETIDFDLRLLLEDFASMMSMRVQEKNLEFLCAASPDVPALLKGDPGRLRQVLTNLVGNAVKFTAKGEVSVRAYLNHETNKDAELLFSIRDTGIGISKEKHEELFQSFTQADASTTREFGGTGLGLTISKKTVRNDGRADRHKQ